MSAKPLDEKTIFDVACGIESMDARNDYLKQVCGDNQALYDRVATLLRMREEEPGFLETPAPGLGALIGSPPITEKPGMLVGPYKLIEEIGEGGMGLVFMARQQEPVKRNVALKIIKPGLDSRQVIARFEAERQALALMDHPNIARVLDAGSTESGRPYFVMDLVKGIPITDYCDREQLCTRERLELFVPVCQAIQHAHQRGVIHRDIKPTNVMVTLHDGTPVPKVIDFGVAKATNRELTQETLVTGFAQVIGTPLYMSPEQAALSGLDVDTRSDVYSLGMLLYELLTGTTPFERQRLSEVSYDEMRRIIREEEPPKPSTRISTLGGSLATIAEQRHTDSRVLLQQVRGELDWIVMKAIEKDRTRRYETARDLAKDVGRHLNNEPVEACPPSATYRLGKFVRRNRGAATALAAVAVSLALGASVATWQAIRATEAEKFAEQQEQLALREKRAAEEAAEQEKALRTEAQRQQGRAEANLRLALEALEEVYIRAMQRRGAKATETQPEDEEEACLYSTLKFYQRFADANRAVSNTRPLVEAVQRKVVTVRRDLVRQSPHTVGYRRALAAAIVSLASLLESTGQAGEAEKTYQRAVGVQEQLLDSFPMVAEYRAELAAIYDRLTNLLLSARQKDRAEKYRTAAEAVRSAAGPATQTKRTASAAFDGFSGPARLQLLGGASLAGDRLRLTPLAPRCAGAAWTAEKQLVAFGFDTVFTFRLSGGADGFAFVIQNHGSSSLGPGGSSQGYGDAYDSAGGIPNSVAVEFDTFRNPENYDLPGDHISVQTNGTGTNSARHAFSLGAVLAPARLDDGRVHNARIRYVPGTLTIVVDGSAQPALTALVELSATLRLDRGRAWVGFTAGTGGQFQTHDILSWEYRPLVDEETADAFLRSYPAKARDTSRPAAGTARQKGASPSEPASSPENFPFLRKALAFYQAFAAQNRDDPELLWEIGKASWRMGEIRAALGDGSNGKLADERSEQAYQTAIAIWQSLGSALPPNAETGRQVAVAYVQRAHTCYGRREFDKAFQYHNRSIQLDPENALLHNDLARALALCPDPKFRNPEQAVALALKAVRLKPGNADCWNTFGVALSCSASSRRSPRPGAKDQRDAPPRPR